MNLSNLYAQDVLVSGHFNILHAEHVRLLEFASRFGKVTVGLNADNTNLEKYGELAVPLANRAYVLRNIRFVDEVASFPEKDPSKLIRTLRPRWFVRGPDYRGQELAEQAALDEVRCKLLIRPGGREASARAMAEGLSVSAFAEMDLFDF